MSSISWRRLCWNLRHELMSVTIYTVINRAGVVFLWPARIANTDGRRGSDPGTRPHTRRRLRP